MLKRPGGHLILTLWIVGVTVALALYAPSTKAETSGAALSLSLTTMASGFDRPVALINAPGDDSLFVVEQDGIIKVLEPDGTVLATPFLDIVTRVDSSSNEEGLLGLAFHPDYQTNGYFYVNYTNTTSAVRRTRISRFSVTANPNIADPNSENILLTITQPNDNHNAGDLKFSPIDGFLYIPLGDGGGSGDTANNAQNLTLLLGKIVRIDVDEGPGNAPDCVGLGSGDYTIPASNPLINGAGGTCDEIWAGGLRNPWRYSFDRTTGDMFIGDVGQGSWEEVDYQAASSAGGENYGWRCYEGNATFNTTGCGPIGNYTFPIFEFVSTGNCSVVGGFMYRGTNFPAMEGHYLVTDYCSGNFWDLTPDGLGGWTATMYTNLTAFGYTAFGEDNAGELYLVQQNGTVYRISENTIPSAVSLGRASANQQLSVPTTALLLVLLVVTLGFIQIQETRQRDRNQLRAEDRSADNA
jgi:glucose/arabinose dehydrogenase